jgi:predicted GNAT family acetyltransferase
MTESFPVPDVTDTIGRASFPSAPEPLIAAGPGSFPEAPPTTRQREIQWMEAALDTGDLTAVPLAELRILANRMFRLLDTDHPPLQAGERYAALVAEIEDRSSRAAAGTDVREVFKDSAFNSRFELYFDGRLAAYIRYSMLGGSLTLRALVEKTGFEGRGLGGVIMRRAMLNAHKRRLSVVPGCPSAEAFLEQNPQYRTLARTTD